MKYNKSFFYFIIIIGIAVHMANGCEEFLEQPADSILTIDSVFNNPDNAMLALYAAYNDALTWNHGFRPYQGGNVPGYYPNPRGMSFGNVGNFMLHYMSDEASGELLPPGSSRQMHLGLWGPNDGQKEFPEAGVMSAMRTCNIFLANVDRVPYQITPKWDWNEDFKNLLVAEVRTLRAFLHFEMFRRFGGIPINSAVSTFSSQPDGGLIVSPPAERQSIESVLNFIVSECDDAMPVLKEPYEFSSSEIGRIHRGFAISLKAKALLYAASPLYNSSTPPVSFDDPSLDSLLCFGTYDSNRWQLAAKAYEDAVFWAESHGYELLDDPVIGKRESFVIGTESPRSQEPKNNESIYYTLSHENYIGYSFYKSGGPIWQAAPNGGVGGAGVNFVRNYYRDIDGNDINIPDEGRFSDLKATLRKTEPRFHACIWVPGMQYAYTDASWWAPHGGTDTAFFIYHAYESGEAQDAHTQSKRPAMEPQGFAYLKKFKNLQPQQGNAYFATWSEFTLPELYLSYIEALNEVDPNDPNILVFLNKIRDRGGLPLLTSSDPVFGDQDKMRKEIRRERAVELFGFEHRYFDVRRWKIADEVMGKEWKQIYYYEHSPNPYQNPEQSWTEEERIANDATLSYRFVTLSTHVWEPKMYFYPWFYQEVNKGIIVQNPGW